MNIVNNVERKKGRKTVKIPKCKNVSKSVPASTPTT